MSKKWYDDWEIVYNKEENKVTSIKVSLPNSIGKVAREVEFFTKLDDIGLRLLLTMLDSALTELSERDKEQNKQ